MWSWRWRERGEKQNFPQGVVKYRKMRSLFELRVLHFAVRERRLTWGPASLLAATCPTPLGQPPPSLPSTPRPPPSLPRPQPSMQLSLGLGSVGEGSAPEGLCEMVLLCSGEEGTTSPSSLALVHPHSGTTLPLGRPGRPLSAASWS